MKTIFEVAEEKKIVIKSPNGRTSLAAEIFPYKNGMVFFDVGWPGSSSHSIHIVPGPISGDEKYWEFGDYEKDGDWAAWVYEKDQDLSLVGDHEAWTEYLKTEEGKKYASHEKAVETFDRFAQEMKQFDD